MRVAVVGTGFARQVHLPGYARVPGIEVVAVCDSRADRAEQVAGELGGVRWCTQFEDVLGITDVDLVDVATPPRLHALMSVRALTAGKAVICEKPMADGWDAASQMAEAAGRTGLVTAMGFQSRYVAAHQLLRGMVAEGYLGRTRLVVVSVFANHALDPSLEPHYATWASMASEGGGFAASALAHSLDLAQYVFGRFTTCSLVKQNALPRKPRLAWDFIHDDPLSADAPVLGAVEVTGDDTAVAHGELPGGGVLVVAGSWAVSHGSGVRIEAFGSDGTIVLEPDGTVRAGRADGPLAPVPLPAGPGIRFGDLGDVPGLFAALAADVLAAFRGEEPPAGGWPFATFADGLAVQRVISGAR